MIAVAALLLTVLTGVHSIIIIDPDTDELELPSGADINVTCFSDFPALWYYPPSVDDGKESSRKSVQYSQTEENQHKAVLFIQHAHYLDTGFYYCGANSSDTEEAKIYLYVGDYKHLLAVNETYALITGQESSDIIIPCKPTSKNVTVVLLKDSEEVDMTFDIHKGFVLKNLTLPDSTHYTCRATRYSESIEVSYELTVLPKSETISKPVIEVSGSEGSHIIVGQDIDLTCFVEVPMGVNVLIEWQIPENVDMKRVSSYEFTSKIIQGSTNMRKAQKILSIKNVEIKDNGVYSCYVTDHSKNTNMNSYTMEIHSADMKYLNLTMQGKNMIQVRAGARDAHWIVHIQAFPTPNIQWYGPANNTLRTSDKYEVYIDSKKTKVIVKDISISDSGVYTLEAESSIDRKELHVTLLVEDQPKVYLNHSRKSYFDINKEETINCTIVAYPIPTVSWSFVECTDYENFCSEGHRHPPESMEPKSLVNINQVSWVSTVKWYASESGIITCRAENYLGMKEEQMKFRVTDIDNGFDVWGPRHIVLSSDNILLGCGASKYEYHSRIDWIYKTENDSEGQVLTNSPSNGISITSNDTLFSYQTYLYLTEVNTHKSGNYICRVKPFSRRGDHIYEEKEFKLQVKDRRAPIFTIYSNMNGSKVSIDAGRSITWNCSVSGLPEPEVVWYKDDHLLDTKNDRIKLENRNNTLHITYTNIDDSGLYKCVAFNTAGNISAENELKIRGHVMQSKLMLWIFIALVVVILLCLVALAIYCAKYKKEQKKRKELISVGLYNFCEGQVEAIDPNLDIGEQADLLPYDKKWEFPRDKLKLGKQLGSGAFGIVLKGEAYGLGDDNDPITVAVKMVKKTSDISHVKSLATELKIMAHLGQHLNVVNLLGACTGNVHNRELLVLVEYCRYGNLHKYLQNHRRTFINQVNNIGNVDFSNKSALTELTYLKPNIYYQANSERPSEYSNGHSAVTDTTSLSTPVGEDGYLLNRDAQILAEYNGDYRINSVRPICSQDLFCWAFQVSKGMSYLASRKVVHGDLAARNVLLAEGNIVKICDFGLAKSIYSRENYKNKKRDIPLPVKWMAIEAISDGIFSTQSDIWSYGIFLWELFSLALTPYPGLYGEEFYQKLLQGYRMEKPQYATEDVYNLMLECWKKEAMLRPSFEECAERLGNMLGQNVKQYYIDLNNPYSKLNSQLSPESDHLSKMVQPTYENCLSSGLAENPPEGYLVMKRSNEKDEPQNEMELKPMLWPGCNSFLNPGYEDMKKFGAHNYSNLSKDCTISEESQESE